MITFRCTSCQQKLSVPAEHAGRKVKCPKCSELQSVPATTQASVEIASPVPPPAAALPTPPPPPPVAPTPPLAPPTPTPVQAVVPMARPVAPEALNAAAPLASPISPASPFYAANTAVTIAPPPSPNFIVRPTERNSSAIEETIASAIGNESQVAINIKRANEEPTLVECLAPPQGEDELGRLGKYRVLSIIGRGGMGVVYKAEDPFAKRFVALKAILPSLGASEDIRKRFMREAVSMAQLEHEHIVRLYEVNEDRNIPFMAMEFLVGLPLDRHLETFGPPPMAQSVRIGREIAEGLAVAHEHGLMHRDIKPANLWIEEPNARVKILDFGLARAMEEDARLTATGAVLGTPAYMSPEQSQGEKVDWRADLFSLGVVLYLLSTGKLPFHAKDALSTMIAVATETPPAPRIQNTEVPAVLSDLIMMLLEKNPQKRGDSARQIAERLGRIERGEPVEMPKVETGIHVVIPVTTETPKSPIVAGANSKLIVVAAIVAALGCLLIGGAITAFFILRR